MKLAHVGLVFIAAALGFAAPAHGAPNVVELVDFACPRCHAENEYVARIAHIVRSHHGVFRLAPVGPNAGSLPSPAVSVYYAATSVADNDAPTSLGIAHAMYAGYLGGADLSNDEAVLSWLQVQVPTLAYRRIHRALATPGPRQRFDRAAWLALHAHVSMLPAFVYLSPATGAILGIDQWQTSAANLATRVIHHLGAPSP